MKMMSDLKYTGPTEEELIELVREAIGAGPDEEISITTPQFTRLPAQPAPAGAPSTIEDWEALRGMTKIALQEMGFGNWDGRLMLFPGEWYSHIPVCFEVEDIFGEVERFIPGRTDNDIRFGCLPYGVPAVDGAVVREDSSPGD